MKVKINREIFSGYALVLLLMVLWFVYFINTSSGEYNSLLSEIQEIISLEQGLKKVQVSDFGTLMIAHNAFFAEPDREKLTEASNLIRQINTEFAPLQSKLAEYNRERVNGVQQNIIDYLNLLNSLDSAASDTELRSRLTQNTDFFTVQNRNLNLIRVELEALSSHLTEGITDRVNDIPSILTGNFRLFFFLFSVVLVISIAGGFFFSHKITGVINKVSEKLNDASENILTTANNEEQMFMEQSESIDKTAETLDELSQFSQEAAVSAQDVYDQMEKSTARMSDLKLKAQEIGKITTTIDEITHQINILSLNASIEASRAGEQGKGFSAVALEIRKLAENTRGFTENITNLIKDIQDYTVRTVDQTQDSFNLVENINNAVSKQNNAISEINETVSQINQKMKESVDNLRNAVVASENVHALAQQLKAMI
ncbi:methyl-accepting chemotaxis protein [candidate division KSB1 bacterium]